MNPEILDENCKKLNTNVVILLIFILIDVVTIEKTSEFFRLIYDVKGRFTVHRITADEAKVSSH